MQILSTPNGPYYTHEWRNTDIADLLKRVKLEKEESVAIYSAPRNWSDAIREAEGFALTCSDYGYTLTEAPSAEQLEVRVWVESWRRHVEAIREYGGTPVVLVREREISPLKQIELTERLGAELITVDEWFRRGGTWSG